MKLSEYIAACQAILAEHGDLECKTRDFRGDMMPANTPRQGWRAKKMGRETKDKFWRPHHQEYMEGRFGKDIGDLRLEKVVEI